MDRRRHRARQPGVTVRRGTRSLEMMTREHGRHLGLVRLDMPRGCGCAGAATRQHRAGGLARAARRAHLGSRHGGGDCGMHVGFACRRLACGLWRDASGGALPLAARARSASRRPRSIGRGARSSRRAGDRRHAGDPLRVADAHGIGLRPRISLPARRPGPTTTSAMCRRNPDARCRVPPPSPGGIACCGCRPSSWSSIRRPLAVPSVDRARRRVCADRSSPRAPRVSEPRGLGFADAREGFVAAVLGRRIGARAAA